MGKKKVAKAKSTKKKSIPESKTSSRVKRLVTKGISNDLMRNLAASVLQKASTVQRSLAPRQATEKLLLLTQKTIGWDPKEGIVKVGSQVPRTIDRATKKTSAKKVNKNKKTTQRITKKKAKSGAPQSKVKRLKSK